MSTAPIVSPSPAELVGRAIAFGLLAVAGIAAIVIAVNTLVDLAQLALDPRLRRRP